MIVQCTAKTEFVLAWACHCRYYSMQLSPLDTAFDGIFTVRSRTPFKILFVVHVGASEQGLVSSDFLSIQKPEREIFLPLFEFGSNEQIDRLGVNDPMAASCRALYPCSFAFIFDFRGQILAVAIRAVPVVAL